jgi:teichuronic acid biosynthesis glycosyltransferase TuaG
MEPLVSVIMPAFNAEAYIADAIRSVVDQTYGNWELLVVDDGSEDATAEIVRGLSSADARIKYVYQRNGGQGKARNTGIRNSSGELVAFLDSDDLWEREKLSLQLKIIGETGADVVFTDGVIFGADDATQPLTDFSSTTDLIGCGKMSGEQMFRRLFVANGIPVLSVVVKRAALERVNLFDESRRYQNCEDYDLWLKLAGNGATFYGMGEKLVRYRRHEGAMTFKTVNLLSAELAVLEKHGRAFLDARRRAVAAPEFRQERGFIDGRLGELRAVSVGCFLPQYEQALDDGRLTPALSVWWRIARLAPSRALRPRLLLGSARRLARAAMRR